MRLQDVANEVIEKFFILQAVNSGIIYKKYRRAKHGAALRLLQVRFNHGAVLAGIQFALKAVGVDPDSRSRRAQGIERNTFSRSVQQTNCGEVATEKELSSRYKIVAAVSWSIFGGNRERGSRCKEATSTGF